MTRPLVVILGAGPSGLAAGHELTRHQRPVLVLEKQHYVGGLCRTVQDRGYRFDLGGHRWFTKNEHLNDWFRRLMKDELVMVERTSRIYYQRNYFYYPIRIANIISETSIATLLSIGATFSASILRQALAPYPIENMEQAYKAQFGTTLYEMFFRQYTEKVWGRPCRELSSDWVAQRSKGLSITSVLKEALTGSNDQQVASLIDEFMYPRQGYSRVPERMAEDIIERGSVVQTRASVTAINYLGPHDFEVSYALGDKTVSERCGEVVSTIPLNVLARIITPACGSEVIAACQGLEFRDLITVNVMINKRQVSADTWLYVQDSDVLFGRLHEPKNWSPAMVPDGDHTSLVLECFCTAGDDIWTLSDEQIAQRCLSDLVDKLGFIRRDEYAGASVVRTRHAYPVYDLDYAGKVQQIKDFLAQFEGLHISGRGGTHRYNNSDHSIEMGLLTGQRILGGDVDPLAVNTDDSYQELVSADDRERQAYQPTDSATRQ